MFDQSALVLWETVRDKPSKQEWELRTQFGELVKEIGRHEIEILCDKDLVVGAYNKKGLVYVRLIVEPRVAMTALGRAIASNMVPRAMDSVTITRSVMGTERNRGLVYDHAHNYAYSPKMRQQHV